MYFFFTLSSNTKAYRVFSGKNFYIIYIFFLISLIHQAINVLQKLTIRQLYIIVLIISITPYKQLVTYAVIITVVKFS